MNPLLLVSLIYDRNPTPGIKYGDIGRAEAVGGFAQKASATFSEADQPANIRNQARMIGLAGSPDRVVPGDDPRRFERFPTQGRIAKIR